MQRTFSSLLLGCLLASAGLLAANLAHAQQDRGNSGQGNGGQNEGGNRSQSRERPAPRSSEQRDNNHNSLSDSVRRAQREPGIRVLSAERVPFDGRDINRMKVIDERGRVRYMDDAGGNRRRTPSRTSDTQQAPSSAMPPPARGDNPSQP